MTDGVTLNPGVGGAKIATDELATINGAPVPEPVHVQRTKVGFGPDGDFRDVDGDHPLPVEVSFPDLQSVSVSNFPETQAVSAASLPLPSGAATAALQTTGNTTLAAIQSALAGTLGIAGSVTVSNFPATQAISAASLPLPTGAATAAAQATGNTALAAISGQLPATLGQKAMAGSLPVTLASDQSALPVTVGNFPATQAVSAAALPLPSGAATAALQTTGNTSLAAIQSALAGTLGIAGSVTVSNFPATQAISAAALPLPTGAATAAAQATGNTALAAISGQLPATLGQKAMAGSLPVTLASDQSALPVTVGNFPATQAVSAASLPLPSGAATAALQTTGNTSLAAIQSSLAGTLGIAGSVTVSNFPATQAISAAALPLPAGAATAAAQATGNTALAAIQSSLAGTLGIAGSVTVSNFPATQAISAAALPLPAGAATEATLAAISGQLPATRGQKAMAASLPVTLASDQSAVNVSPDNVLDNATVSGSANGAATVVSASTAGFMGGSFQVTNAGTSCIVTYEQSNDGTNWVGLPVTPSASPTTVPATTSTAAGHFFYVSAAAFIRARVSTYGSGTVAVTLVQKRAAIPSSGISLQQSSAIIGLVTISGNPVLGASSSTIGNILRQSGFTDSSTTLAASATFTGTGRALNTAIWTRFAATAFADQAGTLFIDLSLDTGTTWRQIASVAVAANVAQQLSVLTTGAAGAATLYRVRYTNGATVQGAFQLSSAFLGN